MLSNSITSDISLKIACRAASMPNTLYISCTDIKKNKQPPEIMLDDEELVSKMNEIAEKEMQNKSTDKEDKKDNEIINNMLEYFKERFENGRE